MNMYNQGKQNKANTGEVSYIENPKLSLLESFKNGEFLVKYLGTGQITMKLGSIWYSGSTHKELLLRANSPRMSRKARIQFTKPTQLPA